MAASSAFPITASGPNNDFFRTAGTNALPSGGADTTDGIRRNGAVGLNTVPLTTLDVAGSVSTNHRFSNSATEAFGVADAVVSIGIGAGAAGAMQLPNAAAFPRRNVTAKVASGNNATVLTVSAAGGSIESPYTGAGSTTVALSMATIKSATWQSDGSNWQLVSTTSAPAVAAAGLSSTVPLADGVGDTRTGAIGVGTTAARADHVHPITRLAQVALPALSLAGGTVNSQNVYRQSSTIETQTYQVQYVFTPTSTGPWKTIVAPSLTGYFLAAFIFNGVYTGSATPYAGAATMNNGTVFLAPTTVVQHNVDLVLIYRIV